MTATISKIINAITDLNNKYRNPNSSTKIKLLTLWEMGDCLQRLGVKKPHAIGWKIQEETKGLIKRPTIFRSHKIRQIWTTKKNLLGELGGLKKMSYLTDMLPLVDPNQGVTNKMKPDEIAGLLKMACSNDSGAFKEGLSKLKTKYAHGRLGQSLDKAKHLHQLEAICDAFRSMQEDLLKLFNSPTPDVRNAYKERIPNGEFIAFSNMCLSLTTKNNYRLYKRREPGESSSTDRTFKCLYNSFRIILSRRSDTERARLRRLISAEAFAQLSDMVSSIQSEELVKDYKARQKISIGL